MCMATNHVTIKGKQRLAVFKAFYYPASGAYLFQRAKQGAKSITYFDLRKILNAFLQEGLIRILNPSAGNGKIFTLTDHGKTVFEEHFPFSPITSFSFQGDLNQLSAFLRRLLAKKILSILNTEPYKQSPLTVKEIRKALSHSHPSSYNSVLVTLKNMVAEGVIELIEQEKRNHIELRYTITPLGEALEHEVRRIQLPPNREAYNDSFSSVIIDKTPKENSYSSDLL